MFKKHFWRKTKLVNLLTANLISLVRRTGRFLRPNMSSQQCLSCDSCLFLIHIPHLEFYCGLLLPACSW